MKRFSFWFAIAVIGLGAGLSAGLRAGSSVRNDKSAAKTSKESVDFAKDVFPILKKHCVSCHGPDANEGQLRLDAKAIVFAGGLNGPAVVAGKPDKSLLLQKVLGKGGGKRMPMDADPLSAKDTATIRAWIEQGAHWPDGFGSKATSVTKHWAYVKPRRPKIPGISKNLRNLWVRNPIDAFVLSRLEKEGLQPSPEADKERLLRRVTLDLTGVPPTVAAIDAFLADDSPNAYEKVVDRLLASPRYGERWAVPWLDAARYADSNGYQRDGRRVYWAYRDWVVDALNADMPFDRFTIEQIAGDLLPHATASQRIATGFHRGTMANVEAGTDPEEVRVLATIDRVNTTGTVWLGTTIQCGQCHNHKYDPFTQRDFYRLFAFFNNTEKEIETYGSRREFIGPKMDLPMPAETERRLREVEREIKTLTATKQKLVKQLKPQQAAWEKELAGDNAARMKLPRRIRLILAAKRRKAKQKTALADYFFRQSAEYRKVANQLLKLAAEAKRLSPPTTLVMKERDKPRVTRVFKRGDFLKPIGDPLTPGTPRVLPPMPPDKHPNRLTLAKWLVSPDNPLTARVIVNRQWAAFFGRGIVSTLEDFGTQGEPPTHPRLLDWLAVEFRGRKSEVGGRKESEGRKVEGQKSKSIRNSQSAIRNSWSLKRLHRLIVNSATYRQSARTTPELLRRDKDNKLLARGPRGRLKAEFVRDNALAIAGLLSQKMHGPPVFPVQPPGVWNHIGVASNKWTTSHGDDLYRRGLYVYWRRTVPYPSFINFDAPSREACTVQRSKSNTPLQALTLLNDPAYFEAAIAFARRALTEPPEGSSLEDRLRWAFRTATSREPRSVELRILANRYREELGRYRKNPVAVKKLLAKWPAPSGIDAAELAAWSHVTNVLLNLDETISR
jgi:mono/diheme cytochrome c family protein